jgi:two-component system, cell cycle response regulator
MRSQAISPALYLALLIAGWGAFALHATTGLGGSGTDGFFYDGVYNVLMFGSALAVLARAAMVKRQRPAWQAMGAGVLCWSVGELYYSLFIEGTSAEAGGSVSLADAFFLAMYPCFYVGLGSLARERLRRIPVGVWLDGVISGLAAATVAAALILPSILEHATGSAGSIVVSSAYPAGDILLLLFAVGALGVTGWRPGRVWLLIAVSMLVSVIADSLYLDQTATGSYQNGTWLDSLWPMAAILIAIAAWTPYTRPKPRAMRSWETISVPIVGMLSAVGVLSYGNVAHQLTPPVLALAMATLVAVGAHLILTLRENLALLASSQRLSLTDPLTGLGNRRRLLGDLQFVCDTAQASAPWELILYDLDGFKRFNDAFGHPAGDALLARLTERLRKAVEPHGVAYRMGGDEFCVLFESSQAAREELLEASIAALCEQGFGFAVTASYGVVCIPTEGNDPSAIMQLADQRLYRHKQEIAAHRETGHLCATGPATPASSVGVEPAG